MTTDHAALPRHTYLFALVDGGGTVPPEMAAARRLVERGHDVTVLAEDSMRAEVDATGARFRRWERATNRLSRDPNDDPYRDWECKNPMELFSRLLDLQFVGPAADYAADTTAAIEEVRPDLVVCSMFSLGSMVAAEAAGVPFDILLPNVYLLPADGMPPFGLGLRPARGPVGRTRDRTIRAFANRAWDKGLPRLNEVRRAHGLDDLDDLWGIAGRARRHLVLTSAEFDFPATLPPNARYVGPVLDDPTWSDVGWSKPDGDGPLVLVGLSSTFQDHVGTIQRVVDALAELPVQAIVTTGPAVDPHEIRTVPRVVVVRSAPHSEILREADLVVTHGGHGTVVKALAAGVPLVILPHGRDQADNAARVTARGAGRAVKRSASPKAIAAAVRAVIDDPDYTARAQLLGESIRRDAASGLLVAELEQLPQRCAT